MRKLLLFIVFLLFGCTSHNDIYAQHQGEGFTIYLVRHSEKESSSTHDSDPSLTDCGKQRSEHLNQFLKDVSLEAVYSTNYNRTISTARPTADFKNLDLVKYNPRKLLEFSKDLLDKKQDALVVGHSNTTGVLAGLLAGQEIGPFDLDIYNRIYRVTIHNNSAELQLLHSSFVCED